MATELEVQRKYYLNFITTPISMGGLGYKEEKSSTVANLLLIKKDIESLLNKPENKKNFLFLTKSKFNNNKELLLENFMNHLHDEVFKRASVAIALRQKEIKFYGKNFTIYFPSGSAINGVDNFCKNEWTVVEELTYKPTDFKDEFGNSYNRRIDLAFFVNGIYFSYCELKHINSNQSAVNKGREKVISNYIEAVKEFYIPGVQNNIATNIEQSRNSFLKLFEKAIHISTSDGKNNYVLRDFKSHFKKIEDYCRKKVGTEPGLVKEIKDSFRKHPLPDKIKTPEEKMKFVFDALYSPKNIENEILYYNYLEYRTIKNQKTGKRKNVDNTGRLITPRPRQKFGVDQVIKRLSFLYENENVPEFILKEYEDLLKDLNLKGLSLEKELAKRRDLNTNQEIYSILLQYAAGFGKTNIMCWLALQMKDMFDNTEKSLFDKILLVSDRLDLRDQVDQSMYNMNIEKNLFKEAKDSSSFTSLLNDSKTRIIIVNIQKFNLINEKLSKAQKDKLSKSRVAFIIDEIHRSNSGEQNKKMTDLFSDLVDNFKQLETTKKNTVIGLTATPSDKILQRFGEIKSITSEGPEFEPFDAYTMKEAIADGYVLNPLDGLVPVTRTVFYEDPKNSKDEHRFPTKEMLYMDDERLETNAHYMAKVLVNHTFKKVGGYGKAMLACYNIDAALKYFDFLNNELYELTKKEDSKYKNYSDARVFIVYSNSGQKYTDAARKNNKSNESEVISEFKRIKNGIIIVVDKLQTGFDDPRLHTLMLDKEVSDINAVQTLCRVNRIEPRKSSCLVLDFSMNNNNLKNIELAFDKYEGLTSSVLSPEISKLELEKKYKKLCESALFKDMFNDYLPNEDAELEDFNLQYKLENYNKELIKDFLFKGSDYLGLLNKLKGVFIGLDKKYSNYKLLKFINEIRILFNLQSKEDNSNFKTIEFFFDDDIGVSSFNESEEEEGKKNTNNKPKANKKEAVLRDIYKEIEKENKFSKERVELMKKYEEAVYLLYKDIIKIDDKGMVPIIRSKKQADISILMGDFSNFVKKIERKNKIIKKEEYKLPEFFNYFKRLKDLYFEDFCEKIRNNEL